jgi:sugar lactone lactonase YvrE
MTATSDGTRSDLFVTNVLNGTVAAGGATVSKGTVLRLTLETGGAGQPPRLLSTDVIGSGFGERTDPNALVVGPTGVGLSDNGTLYVADTVGNRITAIPDAVQRDTSDGTGRTVSSGGSLSSPLGLAVAPGGDVLTVNGGDGKLVETTPAGDQVAVRQLDSSGTPPGAGALFGLAVQPGQHAVYFVDDAANQLDLVH